MVFNDEIYNNLYLVFDFIIVVIITEFTNNMLLLIISQSIVVIWTCEIFLNVQVMFPLRELKILLLKNKITKQIRVTMVIWVFYPNARNKLCHIQIQNTKTYLSNRVKTTHSHHISLQNYTKHFSQVMILIIMRKNSHNEYTIVKYTSSTRMLE